MPLYQLVPLAACIASAVIATAIFARDAANHSNRLAALLCAGVSLWALCEVIWNSRSDAESARFFIRCSAVGWIFLGPHILYLLRSISGEVPPSTRRTITYLYLVAAAFLAANWLTPWMHREVFSTGFGWSYAPGWLHPIYLAFTVGCIISGLVSGWRAYPTASPGEKAQAAWLGGGIVFAMIVASSTDLLLPLAGYYPIHLGTTAMTVFGAGIAWGFHRYGYSLLAPGTFAGEILETLPNGVAMLRLDGRIRSANGTMARLLEATPNQLVDVSIQQLLPPGFALDLTREVTEVECQMCTLESGRVSVSISSKILCDRQGEPIGLVLVIRDVREVVALRSRLVTSDRLAAVGELAAGIAHEINNPLAYVRSNLSLLRRHWQDIGVEIPDMRAPGRATALLAEGKEIIDESLQGVDRAVAIVRDVKGLSHAAQNELEMANINALLDGVARMAASQLPRSVKIEKHYATVPSIGCAPQELQQVFLNLVINAGQALGESGEIRLITGLDGDDLFVRIEDDGCGIPPEVADRIFDPFFTTKAVGEGTGLGLGIALDIVRRHGGSIEAESSPGDGTCFLVRLPIDIDRMEPHPQQA